MRFTGNVEEAKDRTLESTTPRAVKIRGVVMEEKSNWVSKTLCWPLERIQWGKQYRSDACTWRA